MSEKRGLEEAAAFTSKSREGYFGQNEGSTESNKSAKKPRIVLGDSYGKEAGEAAILSPPPPSDSVVKYATDMVGCQGRYVGKCVVVTGGSKGIGEGCARVFFEAGANLVICSRTEAEGNEVVSELMAHAKGGQRIVFVKCDVSKVKDLEHLITETMREFGRIDCLINNAGWHPPPKTIDDFSIEEMQDLFQLNFISYFAACKFALPHIRKTKGNIINMGSWVGGHGQAQAPTYTATKGAITSFSKGLAIDEAEHGVRVNIVSPGNIWTPLWKAWSDGESDPKAAREAGDRVQILGRKGTIIETGRLCLAIAADMTFTTGVDHIQSGGAELGYGMKA
eukprot:m.274108 g.274108  ORF g.274108 m.274108 type:complete len:337 (+) comp26895_c1_seq1:32-1042(+)